MNSLENYSIPEEFKEDFDKLPEELKEAFHKVESFKNKLEKRIEKGLGLINLYLSPKLNRDQLDAGKKFLEELKLASTGKLNEYGEGSDKEAKSLREIFSLDDHFMEATFHLGQELLEKKEFEEAASIFTVLVFLDSFSPESWVSLGWAENGLEEFDEAETSFGTALGIAPEDNAIIFHTGNFYLGRGNQEAAKGFFQIILDSPDGDSALKQACQQLIT